MDTSPDRHFVTELLRQWGSGDRQALDQLMPLVYDQLRKQASRYLRAERSDHTLAATALVHEAYMRLVDSDLALVDRVHFLDRKSTRLNSSHIQKSRMPSSA